MKKRTWDDILHLVKSPESKNWEAYDWQMFYQWLKDNYEPPFSKDNIEVDIDDYIYFNSQKYEYPPGEPNQTSNVVYDELMNFYYFIKQRTANE